MEAIRKEKMPTKKTEAKTVEAASAKEETPSQLEQNKAQAGFSYFLKTRYEGLEKSKKIIKSEGALAEIRNSFATRQEDGG